MHYQSLRFPRWDSAEHVRQMSMKPAVFWGQVSSVCQAAMTALQKKEKYEFNCIFCCFSSWLASQVRRNSHHLFLFCTPLSRWDEFSINKWHTINHALFSLTAYVKWYSAEQVLESFSHLKLYFSSFFLRLCIYQSLTLQPFLQLSLGFRFGFSLEHKKYTEQQEDEWEQGSNTAHLPWNNNPRGGALWKTFTVSGDWKCSISG